MAVIEYDKEGNPIRSGKRIAETMSVVQLFKRFPDEDACYAWLESVRWQGQPVCPHCGGMDRVVADPRPRHHRCKDCRKRFTATTGTCMHSTKKPLQDWVFAIYSVLTARKGISAMQLSKELGCQYKTAWHMLHRIREACGRGEFTLGNVVEADETYIGGKRKNMSHAKRRELKDTGRGAVGKEAVIGARERGGRTIAKHVQATDAATLIPFIEDSAEQGSTVYTDDAAAYGALPNIFNQFQHETVAHGAGEYVRGEVHTNGIESVWAVLKRSITGTWHHVSPKHLGRYVNEATFRLNEGNCENDTIDRMEAFAEGLHGKRLRYVDLIADNGKSAQVLPA